MKSLIRIRQPGNKTSRSGRERGATTCFSLPRVIGARIMTRITVTATALAMLLAANEYLPQYQAPGCPAGYVSSGSYCQKMNRTVPDAFPNYGGTCPAAMYFDGKNCIEMKAYRK
jgi:hypothetical protein